MTDLAQTLAEIRRPRLLIRAARHGVEEYRRPRDLRRILRTEVLPGPTAAVRRLIEIEEGHDARRRAGDASYGIAVHLEVLIALMAEAQALAPAAVARGGEPRDIATAPGAGAGAPERKAAA